MISEIDWNCLDSLAEGTRVAIAFSGGVDSTVAIAAVKTRNLDLVAVQFNYPGRPNGEKTASEAIAATLGVKLVSIEIATNGIEEASALRYGISTALAIFLIDQYLTPLNYHHVIVSTIKDDWCEEGAAELSLAYRRALGIILSMHRRNKLRILLPFYHLKKRDVVSLGKSLGVPFALTWSCVAGHETQCGKCRPCREAIEALS